MSDNKEYEKLAGLTMDEAQVILLALYLADTQKTKAIVHSSLPNPSQLEEHELTQDKQFDFEKLARLGGYGSGQSAVIKFSHARRKLDSFIPFVRPSKKRKRDDGLEDLTAKEMRFSSDR